ncbi:MAG: hypothetical protein SPK31_03305 [Alloprevotella sp.]|nr:hypothetical protein [Bacteroidales bacterium]MDD7563491.1 hypothetical protein [Prevotellamassilia sp.]MDY4568419.1 hypothetical protein [Alloprevotella sp.]MDY5762111.1 hypothetical protein [Alloprevotella sp.]MDY6113604.1 hypothetical protein [Alloprevotella sp.]
MNKKFISVFMIGAATLAPLSTFVSCNDYDDDIKDLQEQIAASGVDLKAEVSRLEGLLDACKAASEKADSELSEAIKNATNDAKGYADIQAAEAKKAAIEAAQSLIEKAIQDLENGSIKAAQAKADAAYLLAEQTSKVAGENKAELEKLAAGLATTNDNLTKAVAALNSRLDEANQAIAETKALAEDNQAKLAVLEAALQSLQASNQQAHDALNAKDNELKALIDANQQAIEATLNTKIAEVNTKISEANAKIAALETRVANNEVSLNEVKTDIANNIKPELVRLAGDITTIQNDIIAINNYLDILNQNLNNLITGLILQDTQLEMVQAQVVSDPGTIAGLTLKETRDGKTYIMFPYKDAKGGAETLTAGEWNVERVAGPVYYTINPTNVNFTDAANINLENSLEEAPQNIAISAPKASERKSPITRAVEAPKNGLYQSTIENSDNHRTSAHQGFKNSYALYTSYVQTAKDGSTINKKVYSQYALNLNVVNAAVQDAPAIVAVGADNAHPATCDARFTTDFGKPLQGKLQLKPVNTEFGKDNGTKKVYKKYVEAIGVTDARGNAITGTKLTSLLTAIANANAGVLNTIFEEDEAGFDEITVNIPDNAGDHSFIGNVITFRYFIQNYNGTIYATTYKVMFVKTLFEEAQVVIEHTPYAAGNITTMHGLTKNDKTEFQLQANCITVPASNALWKNNTAKIEVTAKPDANGAYLHIKNIYFHTASTSGSGWVAEAPLKTIPMNNGMSASVSGLTVTDVSAIKNMVIEYDPEAPNIVWHEYELEMKSYDPNGNLISKLPIKFTMKYPDHHALIKPNPAFFTPYNAELKDAAGLRAASYTLTAWANNNNGTNAKYNIIAAFNTPYSNTDGCALSFDLANKAKYISDANLVPYAPVNAWRVNGPTAYWMEVPAKAVKFGAEHVYTLQLAVQNFGVASLWYNPVEFKVVFKSAIAHADLAYNKETYEVGYPSQTLILNDANVSADDKSTSAADDINYFAKDGTTAHTRDARIKTTSVELVQTQFASLFKTISCTNDEIKIVTNEQVEGGVGSITTDRIQFNFVVEDQYGNVRKYPFYVKVKENN